MSKLYIKGCIPAPELDNAIIDLIDGDEIWTLNNGILPPSGRECNRHFSLHGLRYELKCHGRDYLEWLSLTKADVYLWEKQIALWDEVTTESGGLLRKPENLFAFPIDFLRTESQYGVKWRTYYTGSFAYMLAYVLHLNTLNQLRFKEVHITGVAFSDAALWKSRLQAAEWLDEYVGTREMAYDGVAWTNDKEKSVLRVINDLRGIRAGDESWARECIVYWCGRLEQSGVEVITDESTQLFHNKWLKTHCVRDDKGSRAEDTVCGLYGLCECIGG